MNDKDRASHIESIRESFKIAEIFKQNIEKRKDEIILMLKKEGISDVSFLTDDISETIERIKKEHYTLLSGITSKISSSHPQFQIIAYVQVGVDAPGMHQGDDYYEIDKRLQSYKSLGFIFQAILQKIEKDFPVKFQERNIIQDQEQNRKIHEIERIVKKFDADDFSKIKRDEEINNLLSNNPQIQEIIAQTASDQKTIILKEKMAQYNKQKQKLLELAKERGIPEENTHISNDPTPEEQYNLLRRALGGIKFGNYATKMNIAEILFNNSFINQLEILAYKPHFIIEFDKDILRFFIKYLPDGKIKSALQHERRKQEYQGCPAIE